MPFVITHWINLVAMILLIITGFSIHFPFWGGFMGIARGGWRHPLPGHGLQDVAAAG